MTVELCGFRRASQRRRGRVAAGGQFCDFVKIAGADEPLVCDGAIAHLLGRELFLLQLGIRSHTRLRIAAGQVEHAHVQRMEAGQRNELELVAHLAEFLLKIRDGYIIVLLFPVKRWRAVISKQLPGELRVDSVGELPRLGKIRRRSLAPKHVGIGRIRQAASNSCVNAAVILKEALGGALAVDELAVARVSIG